MGFRMEDLRFGVQGGHVRVRSPVSVEQRVKCLQTRALGYTKVFVLSLGFMGLGFRA